MDAKEAPPLTIKARRIQGVRPGPHLLITGGVHGDEFEPMAAIRRLAAALAPELISGRLTLVPVVNEAAFARGERVAEDDLDLARTCPGRSDGSVTERTAFALAKLIRDADFYIDLHTGGTRLGVLPLAGYMLHPIPGVLERQRRMALDFNLPLVWGTDYRLPGRSLSVARDANVPAIYCEYLGSAGCVESGIESYVNGCLNVMAGLGMLERNAPPSRVQLVVEDDREGAGHMQICTPSPSSGFFEPRVQLGERIEQGALIGTVCDSVGETVHEVRAPQAGLLIVLHTFRSVRQGESLAVIIESELRQHEHLGMG